MEKEVEKAKLYADLLDELSHRADLINYSEALLRGADALLYVSREMSRKLDRDIAVADLLLAGYRERMIETWLLQHPEAEIGRTVLVCGEFLVFAYDAVGERHLVRVDYDSALE